MPVHSLPLGAEKTLDDSIRFARVNQRFGRRSWLFVFGAGLGFMLSDWSGLRLECCPDGIWSGHVFAADTVDEGKVSRAIERARAALIPIAGLSRGRSALEGYALLKSGSSPDSPETDRVLKQVVTKFTKLGSYVPSADHVYEASIDAMFLEALDPVEQRDRLQQIADFLVRTQQSCGGWYYVGGDGNQGDTSITQYGILGLWACARAGCAIPTDVWERAAKWHLTSQCDDGGFSYHPLEGKISKTTMTVAGAGSLLVTRLMLFPNAAAIKTEAATVAANDTSLAGVAKKRKLPPGVLEAIPDSQEKEKKPAASPRKAVTGISRESIDSAVRKAGKWLKTTNEREGFISEAWPSYLWYGTERLAALSGSDRVGDFEWYPRAVNYFLASQAASGEWNDSAGVGGATSFGILTLSRATSSLLKQPIRQLGGGVLVGGRGLPTDLNQVEVKGGNVRTKKSLGATDDSLGGLAKLDDQENPLISNAIGPANGSRTQTASTVSAPTADDIPPPGLTPAELQRWKRQRLIVSGTIEQRLAVIELIIQARDLRTVPILIEALGQPDARVVTAASEALCIIGRKPAGIGVTIDPLEGLPEDATPAQIADQLKNWSKTAKDRWNKWYLDVRPYDQRDDRSPR